MKRKLSYLTKTLLLLAVLLVVQLITKDYEPVTAESCISCVLAVAALYVGAAGSAFLALAHPVLSYMMGIRIEPVTIPAIMLGNLVYVLMLDLLVEQRLGFFNAVFGLLFSSAAKFGTLFLLVVEIICGLLAGPLVERGLLPMQLLNTLPDDFTWPQLKGSLIGGGIALILTPILRHLTDIPKSPRPE